MIDAEFRRAGGLALAAAAISAVGIIHVGSLQMPQLDGITIACAIVASFLILCPTVALRRDVEPWIIVPDEPDPMDRDMRRRGAAAARRRKTDMTDTLRRGRLLNFHAVPADTEDAHRHVEDGARLLSGGAILAAGTMPR
jgi:hypothetical protein